MSANIPVEGCMTQKLNFDWQLINGFCQNLGHNAVYPGTLLTKFELISHQDLLISYDENVKTIYGASQSSEEGALPSAPW